VEEVEETTKEVKAVNDGKGVKIIARRTVDGGSEVEEPICREETRREVEWESRPRCLYA